MSATLDHERGGPTAAADFSTSTRHNRGPSSPNRRRVTSTYSFYGSALALVFSTMFSWVTTALGTSTGLSGIGFVWVLGSAGVYAGEAYLANKYRVTRTLVFAAAWVVNTLMVLLIFGLFVVLGQADGVVSPGAGMVIAILATASAIFATVQLHRSQPRR